MTWSRFNSVLLVLTLMALPCHAGEVIDRIVATVNGHIILQSDWDDEVCFEAFSAGRRLDQMAVFDRKAALDHLIDQELLREQIHGPDAPQMAESELVARIQEIRKLYPQGSTEEGWTGLLRQYGLTPEGLRARIEGQLELMRLVDARLRPSVQIDSKSIESYYNRELLPQLKHAGAQSVALSEVTPRIKELLTQQKVNELLVAWLHSLRSGSNIRIEGAAGISQNVAQ
jgi:hypothetical protein